MEEDDPKVENIIEDVGVGATKNVPENKIKEDVTSTIDEYYDSHTSNDYDEENLNKPIIKKA